MTPNNYIKSVVRNDAGIVVRHVTYTFNDYDAASKQRAAVWSLAQDGRLSVFRPALGLPVIGVGGGF
jgi:hypothetical protein